jgi:acetolactate synthase-1/2/3 large subunit
MHRALSDFEQKADAAQPAPLTMTGGEAIVAGLLDHGVDTVFGLPGAQIYGLFDAFHKAAPKLQLIGARHEQATAYMAYGYARSTGRTGVYAVVPGPGVLNTGAALLTAYGINAPVLCLTGQVPSQWLGRGRGHLHEMPDQLATLRGMTKWATRIEHPNQAPQLVARAFQEMHSGRQGPVALEAPWDYFTSTAAVNRMAPLARVPNPPLSADGVDKAARLLKSAKAPMIMVGGGALEAGPEILELAELLDAPVVAFRSGRGVVSDEHELGLTLAAARRLWRQTDVLLGIGSRIEVPYIRFQHVPPGMRMIRVDIDPAEMRRLPPDVEIVADARDAVRELILAVRRLGISSSPERRERIRRAKTQALRDIEKVQPQLAYLQAIRAVLPRDGFFVDEMSQMGFAAWYGFPVYQPRTFITSGYQGTLGYGFPTALGVKVANPNRAVVSVTGDGGFMFGLQELATAVQHRIGVVTIVFNNEAYGNVRRDQEQMFGGRLSGSDLVNPDFIKLAEAFGVRGERAHSPAELRTVLARALATDQPTLIEVPIARGSEASPWEFMMSLPAENE